MTQRNDLSSLSINWNSLVTRALLGALIGLILISLFLISAGDGDPAWGKFWRIRPLIVVPLAGAGAGLFNYLVVGHLLYGNNLKKMAAAILSTIVFVVALWLGIVLGLDGTMWN